MCIHIQVHGAGSLTSIRLRNQGKVRTYCAVYVSCLGTQFSSAPSTALSLCVYFSFLLPQCLFHNVCLPYKVLLTAWDVHFWMQCSRYLRLLRGLVYLRSMVLVLPLVAHTACNWYSRYLFCCLSFLFPDSKSQVWALFLVCGRDGTDNVPPVCRLILSFWMERTRRSLREKWRY